MEINLGLQMDEETAKKIVGNQQNHNNTTLANGYSFNGKSLSFLTAKHARVNKTDLRYNTEQDLEKLNFELTEAEMKLKKFLKLEHNTIDIINENMKLKELAAFIKATYEQDVERMKEDSESNRDKLSELQSKLDMVSKDLEHRNGENNDLLLTQQKRQKEFDELYLLLEEREREVESANKYSEALLAEKKKLLVIVEQKDRKIENLAKDLYHKDQQLSHQLDDLNRIIRDLQDEKKDLLESLKNKSDQATDLTKKNAELMRELESLTQDYQKAFDAKTRAAPGNKEDDLIIKQRELDSLRDEHENMKASFEKLQKDLNGIRKENEEREKENVMPVIDENVVKRLEVKSHQVDQLSHDLEKLKEQYDEKNAKNDELEHQVDQVKRSLKRADDDNAEKSRKLLILDEQLHKSEDQAKALEDRLRELEKQLELKSKENDLLRDDIQKLNEKIKNYIDELSHRDQDLTEAGRQKDAMEDELDKIRKAFNELEQENIELKANTNGFNTNLVSHFDQLKAALAQKDGKVNDFELQMKKLDDANKELQVENTKLKKQIDDMKRRIGELQDNVENKEKEITELKEDNQTIASDLDETIKDNTDLQTKLKHLEEAYKQLKSDDKEKQKLSEYETFIKAVMYKILKNVIKLKVKTSKAQELLGDVDAVDIVVEEAAIQKLSEDQYAEAALRIIAETEGMLDDVIEDCGVKKTIIYNLQMEKAKLTERAQELEEKYSDIRQRHDIKTDQIGKMSVKMFVLSAELERIIYK